METDGLPPYGTSPELFAVSGDAASLEIYRGAVQVDPDDSASWLRLGRAHVLRREWAVALEASQRAVRGTDDGGVKTSAAWNQGIAATALSDWAAALDAWATLGIDVQRGVDGSPALEATPVALRVRGPDGHLEVVWAQRLDPVRARITNIPSVESAHRTSDILLHDRVVSGKRLYQGKSKPVFDVLERLSASGASVSSLEIDAPTAQDARVLFEAARGLRGCVIEDWTASATVVCQDCAAGNEHPAHDDRDRELSWNSTRRLAVAAEDLDGLRRLLETWARSGQGRLWRDLTPLL